MHPEAPSDSRVAPRHYGFLLFLSLLNVMNFVDRQLLASFANFVVPELGLTNTEFGWLTGFAFIVFYSTMGLFAGALADNVHRPRLVAGALTLWSGLTAASGRRARLRLAPDPAHVHRRRRVGVDAGVALDALGSLSRGAHGLRLRGLLHGAYRSASGRACSSAATWSPWSAGAAASTCSAESGWHSPGACCS